MKEEAKMNTRQDSHMQMFVLLIANSVFSFFIVASGKRSTL